MFNDHLSLEKDKNQTEDIGNDFIVHNMPKADRFAGQTFNSNPPSSLKVPAIKKDLALSDHHKIGIFIMSGGVVLIAVLVYLAYIFLIKPASDIDPAPQVSEVIEQQKADDKPIADENAAVSATTTEEVIASTTPVIETMPTSTEESLAEEKNIAPIFSIVSTIDTDLDGLTDDEEKIIGTNSTLADSDSDSFLDIAELKNGYDPLVAGKKMDDKSAFKRYKIDAKADIFFLNSWIPSYSEANKTIVFTDEDKAFIQLTFQENEDMSMPSAWYANQFPGIAPGEAISGDGWSGFYSQDSAAAYIFSNDLSNIYTVSYSPLIENDLSLPLFRLMVKTLLIK